MSNSRKAGSAASKYRAYLRSPAWRARRTYWFAEEARTTGKPAACSVCFVDRPLELHHLSYDGVHEAADGRWLSAEQHSDLIALCSRDHEAVHIRLDTDPGYRNSVDRRIASERIISALHQNVLVFINAAVDPEDHLDHD